MRQWTSRDRRMLVLPNNFGADWIEKGYPIEK